MAGNLPGGELFFYNADDGTALVGTIDSDGVMRKEPLTGFSTGWTHVTAVGRVLFFYNADTGESGSGTLDNLLHFHGHGTFSGLGEGWTHVVGVEHAPVI